MARKKQDGSLSGMSFSDLYAMYLFVMRDAEKVFGHIAPDARRIVLEKEKELVSELYKRVYGANPFEKSVTVEGVKPEEISLDRFVVAKEQPKEEVKEEVSEETEEEKPQTFVVFKNTEPAKEG